MPDNAMNVDHYAKGKCWNDAIARGAACRVPTGLRAGCARANARTARLGPSGMRRHGDQRRQADVQLAEIAPALLLAIVAEKPCRG